MRNNRAYGKWPAGHFPSLNKGDATIRILFLGDIVGSVGRHAVKTVLPRLRQKYDPHVIVANGENAAGGKGITAAVVKELTEAGVHAITLGNHAWDNKDIFEWIEAEERVIRPANYPEGTPGRGCTVVRAGGYELFLINLQGRTFLPPIDCPFRKADELIEKGKKYKFRLIDFHAEATSEKIAFGWHVAGRVSLVVGTHTHVQTNDHRILPGGTGYVTDVGMVGAADGVIGMDREAVLRKFRTQLPTRLAAAEGKWHFHALFAELDDETGCSIKIELLRIHEDEWWNV
mgnify:CR=1 FL=1